MIHRQSPLRDSSAGTSCARFGSSFLRDFGDGGGEVSSIRGRFVLDGLSGLRGEVGEEEEGEGDKGELVVEGPSSGGQRREAELVCTERGAGSLEGFGESSWMLGFGCGQTMSVLSQGSSESALRLRGSEWRGMDSWAMSSMRRGRGRGEEGAKGRVYNASETHGSRLADGFIYLFLFYYAERKSRPRLSLPLGGRCFLLLSSPYPFPIYDRIVPIDNSSLPLLGTRNMRLGRTEAQGRNRPFRSPNTRHCLLSRFTIQIPLLSPVSITLFARL